MSAIIEPTWGLNKYANECGKPETVAFCFSKRISLLLNFQSTRVPKTPRWGFSLESGPFFASSGSLVLPSERLAKCIAEEESLRQGSGSELDSSSAERLGLELGEMDAVVGVSPLKSFARDVVSWASGHQIQKGLDLDEAVRSRKAKLIQSLQKNLNSDSVSLLPVGHPDLLEIHRRLAAPFIEGFNRANGMGVRFVENCYALKGNSGNIFSLALLSRLYGLNIWQLSSLAIISDWMNSTILAHSLSYLAPLTPLLNALCTFLVFTALFHFLSFQKRAIFARFERSRQGQASHEVNQSGKPLPVY
ncbi:hypothetical protein HWI79_3349 [Cryptosporidium felis]|nr:hypothetical protein HWI79_3349 [Cryptosporidium felis]